MSPTFTRFRKEAHHLSQVGLMLLIFAALPLPWMKHPGFSDEEWRLTELALGKTFYIFLALAASLPWLLEIECKTLPLLLTQPLSRARIWTEKTAAVFALVIVLCPIWIVRFGLPHDRPVPSTLILMGVLAMICSTAFWVNWVGVAGIVFNVFVHGAGGIAVWRFLNPRLGAHPSDSVVRTAISAIVTVTLCYSGVMLWLGKRRYERMQILPMAGANTPLAGDFWLPGALAGALRSRPTGALANMIRKEIRVQRVAWILALPVAIGWACFVVRSGRPAGPGLVGGLGILFAVLVSSVTAIFAGSAAVGEEMSLGTYTSMMTLPVSSRRLWSVKLGTALFAALCCTVLIPWVLSATAARLFHATFEFWPLFGPIICFVSVATVISFTGSSAWPGTPAAVAAGFFGTWGAAAALVGGEKIGELVIQRWWHGSTTWRDSIVARGHLDPREPSELFVCAVLSVAMFMVAIPISERLFRPHSRQRKIASLGVLAFAAFAFSFGAAVAGAGALPAPARDLYIAGGWQPLEDAHKALVKLGPRVLAVDAAHPLRVRPEELPEISPLTQQWLEGSTISVARAQKTHLLTATVRLVSGSDCFIGMDDRGVLASRPSCHAASDTGGEQ